MSPQFAMSTESEEVPRSRSLERALAQLALLRRELGLEIHLASSDAREAYRKLEPQLRDLERFRDGSERSFVEVRQLLSRAADLCERVRHPR